MNSQNHLHRLLRGTPGTPASLEEHEKNFPVSPPSAPLHEELEASGLTGRGGSAFPTAIKARLLSEQPHRYKSVVVNAMEGEPASHKDAALLSTNPHLVLDGAEALGAIIGANDVIICIAQERRQVIENVRRAINERLRRGGRSASFVVQTPPERYIAGEESALTHWLNEHQSLPLYRPHRPVILTVNQRAVLVDNAETCAHVGLIARTGAEWFRSAGTPASPGTTLVTLSGAVERPTVLEVALGTPLSEILTSGRAEANVKAVLLGGYSGTWLDGSLLETPYTNEALRPLGSTIGAGVVVVLGADGCGLVEVARIAKWMGTQSAHQCGPCSFGLPSLAQDLAALASGSTKASDALDRLEERCEAIIGRGACHHPDGVVRLVRSTLEMFSHDAKAHAHGQPCAGAASGRHFARIPGVKGDRRHEP